MSFRRLVTALRTARDAVSRSAPVADSLLKSLLSLFVIVCIAVTSPPTASAKPFALSFPAGWSLAGLVGSVGARADEAEKMPSAGVKPYTGRRVGNDTLRMIYYHDQTVAVVELGEDKLLLNCELIETVRVGSGRGQISAYPRQLESLIRLAEAHARVRLAPVVEILDVDEAARLHREALKQSATDPASGRIDVGILTTGLGAAARRRRADLVAALKEHIQPFAKPHTMTHSKLLHDVNVNSQITVSREQLDEALRDLQDEGKVVVVSHTHLRLC